MGTGFHAIGKRDADADAYTIGQVAAGLPYANAVATGHAHNPDTLPTPLSPPDLSTTPILPSPPTDTASTVSTTVKHAAIRIPYNTKPNRIFQFKDVFQFINKC